MHFIDARHGFPGSLDLLQPRLTTAFNGAGNAATLATKAAALAPIRRGGFECRLAAGDHPLDVQQCVFNRDGEPAQLLAHLQDDDAFRHPIWQRVRALVAALAARAESWTEHVAELWLEFDADGSDWLPSIFVGATPGTDAPTRLSIWAALFELLQRPLPHALQRCTAQFGDRISHLGFMLGRSIDLVRVNVKKIPAADAPAALDELGWPGERAAAAQMLDLVQHMGCDFTLCLDVGDAVAPSLACECYYPPGEGRAEQWTRMIDLVVARGLCDAQKGAALTAWPGIVAPQPGRSWPLDLLAESLKRPQTDFTHFDCRISHIKLGVRPHRPLEAKGYLWFNHRWGTP